MSTPSTTPLPPQSAGGGTKHSPQGSDESPSNTPAPGMATVPSSGAMTPTVLPVSSSSMSLTGASSLSAVSQPLESSHGVQATGGQNLSGELETFSLKRSSFVKQLWQRNHNLRKNEVCRCKNTSLLCEACFVSILNLLFIKIYHILSKIYCKKCYFSNHWWVLERGTLWQHQFCSTEKCSFVCCLILNLIIYIRASVYVNMVRNVIWDLLCGIGRSRGNSLLFDSGSWTVVLTSLVHVYLQSDGAEFCKFNSAPFTLCFELYNFQSWVKLSSKGKSERLALITAWSLILKFFLLPFTIAFLLMNWPDWPLECKWPFSIQSKVP